MPEGNFRANIFKKMFQNLDTKMSSEWNGIPAIKLNNCFHELAPILICLYQISIESDIFLIIWKTDAQNLFLHNVGQT